MEDRVKFRWRLRMPAALVAAALFSSLGIQAALAHANLVRAEPAESSVISVAPAQVQLWFSEGLEKSFSSVSVLDKDGKRVSAGDSFISPADPKSMSVALGALQNGVYTVIWQALSTEDGHQTKGAFAFAIGDPATTAAPVSVSGTALGQQSSGPSPVGVTSRWLNFLAPVALIGAVLFQLLILTPLFRGSPALEAGGLVVRRRYHRLIWISAIGLIAGWPLAVLSQAMIASGRDIAGALAPDVVGPMLATRYGSVLLARGVLIFVAAVLVWWLVRSEQTAAPQSALAPSLAVIAFGLGVLGTSSLVAHASGAGDWAWLAILADWLHLVAVAAWIGGVFAFSLAIGPFLRAVEAGQRGPALARMIPRFSRLAIASTQVLILTGLYAMWLHFPSVESLWTTDYGKALIAKLVLFFGALGLGALNLLVITPALKPFIRRSVRATIERGASIAHRFGLQVRTEAVLGVLILLIVSVMITLPPASVSSPGGYSETQQSGVLTVNLRVTPNEVGPNRYIVKVTDFTGQPAGDVTKAVIRFQMLDHDMGQQEKVLEPGPDNTWVAESSNLSMGGNWGMRVILRRLETDDTELRFSERLGRVEQKSRGPFPRPADFGLSDGVFFPLGMLALGLLVTTAAYNSYRRNSRIATVVQAGGLAVMIFGALWIVFRTPVQSLAVMPENPVPVSAESVERGRQLYAANCSVCHGTTGKGDGPLAAGLNPKPADLSQHVAYHPEGQLYLWISSGVEGTAMPVWQGRLAPDQIWDVVNYLRGTFVVGE